MGKAVLLAQLRALLESTPDFDAYSPTSREHHEWVAKAHSLVNCADRLKAQKISLRSSLLSSSLMHRSAVNDIMGSLHRVSAALELEAPKLAGQAFAPGAVYDFFKALHSVLGSAQASILIIDPYLDNQIFDAYVDAIPAGVSVRLLANQYEKVLKQGLERFNAQHGTDVQARISKVIHDRVVFVDDLSCWVMGQSIKDAAKAKPTYLLELPTDVAKLKLAQYRPIWNGPPHFEPWRESGERSRTRSGAVGYLDTRDQPAMGSATPA